MKYGTGALVSLAVVGAAVLWSCGDKESLVKVDEASVLRVLGDRTQAWFGNHSLPKPRHVSITYSAPEAMGAFPAPPVMTPVMPVDVACYLSRAGGKAPAGHPLHGREAKFVDMRIRSLYLMEHLPGSVHAPWNAIPELIKSGKLESVKKNDLVIVYGEVFPHFDAPQAFRAAGYDAVYCLEGGMNLWKERGYPVETRPDLSDFAKTLKSEEGPAASMPGPLDPENIGPVALQTALDLGLKPMIVFVGDEATFLKNHIPGAVRVPQPEIVATFEAVERDRLIVIYCGCCEGLGRGLSGTALGQLKGMGFKRLFHLEGHLKGWIDAGLPVVTQSAH